METYFDTPEKTDCDTLTLSAEIKNPVMSSPPFHKRSVGNFR